ncbi:MAG: TIGR02217 family protein [Altererythrobacter sp.]|nr:TIGR02217 family protein [Altererythrobacter sp.]
MPFWLADTRRKQHADWIARFDPRFWTVNFPRPMMASVVTTAPDALRVECEFYHEGELAGLIWESEDRLDHPLLAYRTERDYGHCVLRFRWRSSGLVPLDQANGPTLTIEGKDANGTSRAWYVRLWNYASGSPEDAEITLPFSQLESGWALPGEKVHVAAIERMFISLAPRGFAPGSATAFPARRTGWAEMRAIACEGERAVIAIGDVILPAHGEQMATAYDDSFNQTPARLLRQIEQLGYRGRIVHYVGMSHYYRLRPADLLVEEDGTLSGAARAWHADYFARAVAMDFAPIASLSFELLAQNCPDGWKQRDHAGHAGETGWDPPSALFSPCNTVAMAFLRAVAVQWVTLLEEAGADVLFQIGEPWWWVQPASGAPCLYDAAAHAEWGDELVTITDMRQPLDADQTALLDRAGAALGAATAGVADAVRAAATGEAEILLLAFTPTVLDPAMPELYRANLPLEWAWPAFDRLQLEDYDWLTAGHDAARRKAREFVDRRLGYPIQRQDYLSGFVLRDADAENFWPRIDAALDEARGHGIGQRFIWALPQIVRDGYVRLPTYEDNEMNAFDDVAYPLALGRDASVSPEFSTSVAVTASGHERRNALWSDARLRYDVGPGIRSEAELRELLAFYRARYGPARGFRLRDPFDHSSAGGDGEPGAHDELIGIGDGKTADFRLVRNYGDQQRRITRPVPGSILVSLGGDAAAGWRHVGKGVIRFGQPPAAGMEVRAGFLFDVPVRFAEDRLDISSATFAAGEAPSVPLVEIREAP